MNDFRPHAGQCWATPYTTLELAEACVSLAPCESPGLNQWV
jgi:hypothetical protein